MIHKRKDTWIVYNMIPFVNKILYHISDSDIDKFIEAVTPVFKNPLFKDEVVAILHGSKKCDFLHFKSILYFDNQKLYRMSLDYQGCYSIHECNQYGWTEKVICYTN